jgi:NAD-dependent SIR2 family protein deacetylase
MAKAKERAVIILGAGASIEYGIPATIPFTDIIETAVLSDRWVQSQQGDLAYKTIKRRLKRYLRNPGMVHFEQIYHCAHELIYFQRPDAGAVDEYRPILVPFLKDTSKTTGAALRALVGKITDVIYREVSARCGTPAQPIDPFRAFLRGLEAKSVPRLYTTNYDDFALQAAPNLYTGYDRKGARETTFDVDGFWGRWNDPSLFYLHGSVHMSYSHRPGMGPFADLVWFDDRDQARKSAHFSGSGLRRMDGSEVLRAPIVTGLDKLSRLQQRPLPYFYAALARDVMEADVIYVIGAGLGDLHLSTLLAEARERPRPAPLLFVDWWKGGFDHSDTDRKAIEMFHSLRIHVGGSSVAAPAKVGEWLVAADATAAIWSGGFQRFLQQPAQHDAVRKVLRPRGP